MTDRLQHSFGLVIAYILPGLLLTTVGGLYWPDIGPWLAVVPPADATLASFLHVALASLAVGLTVSAVRWALIDTIHHHTGVPLPAFDFSQLQEKLDAFQMAVEHYYKYYQFYANMFVAIALASLLAHGMGSRWYLTGYLAIGGLELVLFIASRDSLRRYYRRSGQLLGTLAGE